MRYCGAKGTIPIRKSARISKCNSPAIALTSSDYIEAQTGVSLTTLSQPRLNSAARELALADQ
jgi:hypothetical protein